MKKKFRNQIVLAAKCKSEEVLLESQSGGMFSLISDFILENGGVIYAAEMLPDFSVRHKRAVTKEERDRMRGSKYVQSDLGDTFLQVKKDLQEDRKVLFVGTPCQVAGLKLFLRGKNTENLTLVDIVCHGVPSPGVWKDFLDNQKKKYSDLSNVIFRNKKYGWESSICTFEVDGKEHRDNTYNTLFYRHYIVRPSCYHCLYKNLDRPGDFTIGDCWGLEKDSSFYDKNGVSILLINNQHALDIFQKIEEKMVYQEVDIAHYLQPALSKNYSAPAKRRDFWQDYQTKSFSYISRKYGGNDIFTKTKRRIKKLLKKRSR